MIIFYCNFSVFKIGSKQKTIYIFVGWEILQHHIDLHGRCRILLGNTSFALQKKKKIAKL